ncbi:permease for cytosine/purines, uracil, thiamine, allantoin-domain-containing protein [Amylocarpus encephaloides]|uniref:Permease for cytosine/purines, uracil, thiamine, allantoin-domain-containing protein n=1 Tax=Amylocarpus encephaloides TaxID=45428 RepID=A0A9P7YND8_9HELO|nr:permease for cytosine/purines, uracil, thiamine, allantoin-domain-containing protein [Amylocarpus encephaloides]
MSPPLRTEAPPRKSSLDDDDDDDDDDHAVTCLERDHECTPLLAGPSRLLQPSRRHSTRASVDAGPGPINPEGSPPTFHSSDEPDLVDFIMEKVKNTKLAYYVDKLAVESEPGLTNAQLMLNNHDLKPVEPARRQWGPWNFVGFWIADSFNINTWMISSSMIVQAGLSWWQSWLCVWIGYSIAACFIVLTGRIGATYHISFPVASRSSFGIWGALWPVFNRAAMACIWYGVQAWIGGHCVKLMISAIWPSFQRIPNGIPDSGTTTYDFVAFFLFWAGSLPAIWFPVHKIRHLFTAKAIVVPTAGVAFFIWAIVRAHGIGPIVHQPATSSGSKLGWGMVTGIMSSIANFATLIVNDPDFSRFAKKPKDAFWSQLLTIPLGFAVTSFIGIIVSSSSTVIFQGDPIWDPLELLQSFLDEGGSANRAGVFFIASAFCLAQLGTNIAANSVSAGTDMTALLPRYLNIRRGGYVCALVGLVMCPWNLLSSANNFTTYLSAYSVFLSSIAGVIISDYYAVRRGYLEIRELYSAKASSPYHYTLGVHWRGYAAYLCGILINIVGFVGAIGQPVPRAATYIYNVNFFGGFLVASATYYALCRLFPVPATSDVWMEVGDDVAEVRMAYDADGSSGHVDREGSPDSGVKGFTEGERKVDLER